MNQEQELIDDLANEIRRVDGAHALGAGALAEALMPWLADHDTEVRRKALDGAADVIESRFGVPIPGGIVLSTPESRHLRTLANAERLKSHADHTNGSGR